MDNFDLKKYLAEGRLLKEEIMVDTITMFGGMNYLNDVIASPEDYGFDEEFAEWIKNTILTAPKTMSMDDHMDLQNAFVIKGGIEVGGGGDYDHILNAIDLQVKQGKLTPEEGEQAKKIALNYSDKPGDGYKKYLAEGRLFEEKKGDIVSFLNAHVEEVKNYLRKKSNITTNPESLPLPKQIDKITSFDYDGSDEDVTPRGKDNSFEVDLGVAFNWPESPSLRTDGEEPEIIKIGGENIGVKFYDI